MRLPPNILSLSTVFPRPDEPLFGLFVARRLEAMAELAPVEAVVPVPWLETSGARWRLPRLGVKGPVIRGRLRVHYRRWLYPPGLGVFHPAWLVAQMAGFLRRLRGHFRFDVIDAHFGYPEGVAAFRLARRLGVPYMVTLRGNELIHAQHPARSAQMAEAFRNACAVVAVSGQLKDLAVRLGASADRCFVIGNGVDTAVFHPRPRQEARRRLRMDPSRLHILSAGWLVAEKGHHRIARLLPRLHAAGIPADLWVLGNPGRGEDARGELARIAQSHRIEDHLHVLPAVEPPELAEYMSACDVFCLASMREGWPNVVQEALACGAPVVATQVGAVPDLITDSSVGAVVPPGDDESLFEALGKALETKFDRDHIARVGASRSWRQVAGEVLDVIATTVTPSCAEARR